MIRKATLDDIKVLVKLLYQLFSQEDEFKANKKTQAKALQKIIKSKKIGDIFVVQKNDKVVAMVTILYAYSTALDAKVVILEDMIVDKKYRQKGYGSKLLRGVLKILKNKKIKRVTLLSDDDNISAHKFYKKFRFEKSNMVAFRNFM